jgi:quinone-modifying oxidoreductase subunit QmoC
LLIQRHAFRGKRDEVLKSDSMWMCTSCYNCIVRCPRGLPITHIMHGLASYAQRLGLAPKEQPTRKFSLIFWDNLVKTGRVNEATPGIRLYFMNGFINGIKTALKAAPLGLNMLKTGRFDPMALVAQGGCYSFYLGCSSEKKASASNYNDVGQHHVRRAGHPAQ